MRWTVVWLVVLVLLGAAVNVPFALRFARSPAARPPGATVDLRGADAAGSTWPGPTPHAQPWPDPTSWSVSRSFGYAYYDARSREPGGRQGFSMIVEHVGWPLAVLEREQLWWPWNDPAWDLGDNALASPPMRVVWRGAIGNPLIFGVVLWFVLVLPIAFYRVGVRRGRIGSGRCPDCGYPAGGSELCTECGRALPEQLRPAALEAARVDGEG